MSSKNSTLGGLTEKTRAECMPPGEISGFGSGRIVSSMLAALGEEAPKDSAHHRARAEAAMCVLLPGVAQRDPGGLRESLQLLLRLGVHGRAQISRLLSDAPYPVPQLIPIMEALPDREKLHLVNTLCLLGGDAPGGLHEFALSWAARGDDFELAAVIEFLADLDEEGETLCWPLKKAFRNGGYAEWAVNILPGDPERAAEPRVLAGIGVVGLPEALRRLFAESGSITNQGLLRLAASMPELRDDQAVIKALVGSLAKCDEESPPTAASVLDVFGWDKLGAALSRLFLKHAALRRRLAFRLLLLGERTLNGFLKQFGEEERSRVTLYLFLALSHLAPEFCRACLGRRELGMAQGLSQAEAAQLETFLLGQERRGAFPALAQSMGKPTQPQRAAAQGGGGLLSRIFGRDKTDLQQAATQNRVMNRLVIEGATLEDASLSERGFRDCKLPGCRLQTIHFESSAFVDSDFSSAVMHKTVFSKCTFSGVSFRNAWFLECTFAGCEFKGCDLSGAVFHGTKLNDLVLRGTHLGGSTFFGAKLLGVRFLASQLAEARLHRAQFRSCSFESCSLAALRALESTFSGVEFSGCDFSQAWFESSSILACVAKSCRFPEVKGVRCKTDEPHFIAVAEKTREQAALILAAGCDLEAAPPALLTPHGAAFMESVLGFWCRHRDMARLEAAMLAANARRLEMSDGAMGSDRVAFVRLLPLLLHSDAFERANGFEEIIPCTVEGFVPTLSQLALLKKHFPEARIQNRSASSGLRVIGLYTIGSIGTLAQAERSDLDCWVCVDGDAPSRGWLKQKLERLETWAMEKFGLETHFFLMTVTDVRENRFGLSDEESSGSAQALLLKDEFYRTCLRLAGRVPVWWIMPPGINDAEYRARLPQALRFPLLEPNRSVDLGPLETIPRGEFFGACLWQIVKAIKSPFKSIMKFALLECYARSEAKKGRMLLCEALKESLLLGSTSAKEVDPYLLLFERVRRYYKELGNHEALYLLREAFMQRFAVERDLSSAPPAVHEGFDEVHALLPKTEDHAESKALLDPSAWSFSKSSRMGALISKFLTDSYGRIRDSLDSGDERAASRITPEDMTKLGRRIMAMFARREQKVELLPFFKLAKRAFRELGFTAQKTPGRKPKWIIKGKPYSGGDTWETLRISDDPATLFVWLVVNGLFTEKLPLHGDATIAPFSHEDVVGVLRALKTFFPKSGFQVGPEEFLEEETVSRVFFICNLTAARDAKELKEVWTVYQNNWGEIFCVADLKPDQTLRRSASQYLAQKLDKRIAALPELECWQPKRSHCPRIVLA